MEEHAPLETTKEQQEEDWEGARG
eukprot:COSAG03_NODE_27353_length_253_cov_1.350649_2_plen_24_part_01